MKAILLCAILVAASASAQEAAQAPRPSDCDFHAPAIKGIMARARIENRLRPGGWAHFKAADGGGIVCLYKDKYLKLPAELKSVDDGGDDLVLNDAAGSSFRVPKSRLLLGNGFAREQDVSGSAWLVAATAHEKRYFTVSSAKYGDAPEDQAEAEDKALAMFVAEDGAAGFRGEGKNAKKRRACLKSWIEAHAAGVTLYPDGSPADGTEFADAPGPKGGRVVDVNGELMIKTGADDFRPCP